MDYPDKVKQVINNLNECGARYAQASLTDNPGDAFEDIKNDIMSNRASLITWINAYNKTYAEHKASTEKSKSKEYKRLLSDTSEVTKSNRIEHIRYTFKGEDAEQEQLKALVDNMKRWDKYYQDVVINIQSSLSNIRTERRVEGI